MRVLARPGPLAAVLLSLVLVWPATVAAGASGKAKRHAKATAAAAAVKTEAKTETVLLQADEILFNGETGIITAQGHVEAEYEGRILMADRIIYDKTKSTVTAEGHVSITEPTGQVVQSERVELSSDLKNGVIDSLSAILGKNSRLSAARALRSGGTLHQLDKAVFSACKICKEKGHPLWQIKAVKVVHDAERKRISYRDATFELFGVPVFYTPYFSHVDPSVKRKSGLLAPTIGNSTDLGIVVRAPVYIVLKPNMDLTLTPMVTTNEGVVGFAEFRHRTLTGQYYLDGSVTRTEKVDEETGQVVPGGEFRGHLFGEGNFKAGESWKLGFKLELTSDDTYLRRYDITDTDRLTSHAYADRWTDRSHFRYNAFYFDGLRLEDDPEQTPLVPAHIQHQQRFRDPLFDGTLTLDLSGLALIRTGGGDTFRFSGGWTWELPFTTRSGQVFRPFATVRGDVYYTKEFTDIELPGADPSGQVTGRVLPYAGIDWRWPFIRQGRTSHQIIEPVVQVITSPYGGNPDGIPNEDSTSFEFDDTNLFSRNKFPGLDLYEEGPRLNAGLRFAWFGNSGRGASMLVGQSYRLRNESEFGPDSGLENEISDLVGRINFKPFNILDITHRFRLDPDDLAFRRNEVDLTLGNTDYYLKLGYVNLDSAIETTGLPEREEVAAEARLRLSQHWSVRGGVRRDLIRGDMVATEAGLLYLDECTEFGVAFKQRFTEDRDFEPSTSVMVRFRLLGIGS